MHNSIEIHSKRAEGCDEWLSKSVMGSESGGRVCIGMSLEISAFVPQRTNKGETKTDRYEEQQLPLLR